jgi:hypothetical protein
MMNIDQDPLKYKDAYIRKIDNSYQASTKYSDKSKVYPKNKKYVDKTWIKSRVFFEHGISCC